MEKDTAALWNDVRRYEEALAKDPRSFCFAPLSDVYRRMGMLEEAIEVARKGCEIHPDYVGGHMALGRACFEKGMREESLHALEKVIKAMPDNLLAHRMLSRLYRETGNAAAAEHSLRIVCDLTGEDKDYEQGVIAGLLGADLAQHVEREDVVEGNPPSGGAIISDTIASSVEADEDEIIELTEEVFDEEPAFVLTQEAEVVETAPAPPVKPFNTVTMAELYASQGLVGQAIDVYRELVASDPDNEDLRQRLETLESSGETPGTAACLPAADIDAETVSVEASCTGVANPPMKEAVLEKLEKWLANIRRR